MNCSFQSNVFVTLALDTAFQRLPRPHSLEYTEKLPQLTTTIEFQINFDLKKQGLTSINVFIPDQQIIIAGFNAGLLPIELINYKSDISECKQSIHADVLDLDLKTITFI